MIKSKLLNICLIANLSLVWLVPQPSLAFSLFGPSDAEKQILFLQGYNAGIARVTATDGTKELTPVNPVETKTTTQTYPAATTATVNTSVTNPLSADLDTGNFKIINSNSDRTIRLDGNLSLQNGQWPWALYAPRVNVQNHEVNVNAIGSYSYGDRSTAGQFTVAGANAKAGSFVAAGPSGYAVFAKVESLPGSASSSSAYAGYFDGKVKVTNGDLVVDHGTIKVDSASEGNGILSTVLVNGGTAIRGVATPDDSFAGGFLGNVDIDRGMLTINNPYSYSVTTPPAVSTGLGVSGNTFGIVGFSYGSGDDTVGILGRGVNGVKGEAAYGNGKAIWGVTWPDEYPDSYAGYFDGRVVATDGLRTTKICVGNNLEDPGACLEDEGIVSIGANSGIFGSALSDSGTGVLGQGFKGVYGRAVGNNSIGVYGAVASGATNALAARFDGETEIAAGNLIFSNNLNPRIDVNTNVASTLGINFDHNPSTGRIDDWGINSLSDFIFTSNNRLGIGTVSPNANLHLKTASGNAELDIQSGNNTHWGIYQNMTGGALNFWHGDNRLTINDQGITTNGICIGKTCITKWEDLKAILNTTPTPTKPGVVPTQQ